MDASPGPDDVAPIGERTAPGSGPTAVPGDAPESGDPVAAGSLGSHPERHPDDLPPAGSRRAIPAGVLWALALAVVVLGIASWVAMSSGSPAADDVVHLGGPVTTVDASGLGATDMTGQPVPSTGYTTFGGDGTDLTAHAGTPMVVNFWASSCAPCITEMPAFERVHQALGDQVAFVGLAVSDQESAARDLALRTGVTYELGFDPTGTIIRGTGGVVLPTTVLVAPDGTIVESHSGALSEDDLRTMLTTHFGIGSTTGS